MDFQDFIKHYEVLLWESEGVAFWKLEPDLINREERKPVITGLHAILFIIDGELETDIQGKRQSLERYTLVDILYEQTCTLLAASDNLHAYLLVDDEENLDAVRAGVQDVVRRFSQQDKDYEFSLMGQPDPYWLSTFRQDITKEPDLAELAKDFLYILLALLFIPALNLGGMISSRMDSRIAELGIRKAYGATRRRLLEQVLCENLLLTLMGGLAGLLFSYLIVWTASDWILTLFDENIFNTAIPTSFTPEMLFSPAVFGCTLGVCLLLNVVSAIVPALRALRHPIMDSLNTKR